MISPKAERNAALVARAKEGATFRQIGLEFGITRERARQICLRAERMERDRKSVV